MARNHRDPDRRVDGTWWDKAEIGHNTFYCFNADCPDNRWPDGHYKFMPADHFNNKGECKHRARKQV